MEDVGIDQDQFNVGQQMLSLGIVLTEIPSNMILYRVGPGKWLTLQLFLFGIVSTFQAFQHGYGAFIATRFLLGITESGFIPGGLWTLSTWYTRDETAKRIMVFYFGNQIGQASAKLLAFGILHMRGVGGKPGWFWLFALMGAFTVIGGFIYGFFLPDSFKNPHSTFLPRVKIFTDRELHILQTRVLLDDPMKGKKKAKIGLDAFKRAMSSHPILYIFSYRLLTSGSPRISTLTGVSGSTSSSRSATTALSVPLIPMRRPSSPASVSATSSPTPWLPSVCSCRSPSRLLSAGFLIISKWPHEDFLCSIQLYLSSSLVFFIANQSNTSDRRGETVMLGLLCHLIGYIFNRCFTDVPIPGVRYFGVVWTQVFGTFSHPLNIAWMSLTCRDSEQRALAMAGYACYLAPLAPSPQKIVGTNHEMPFQPVSS